MRKPLFTGVCTALVTPFLNGQINYPMLQMLLKAQLDAGIRAVVLAGTTGEAPTLSDEEKLELLRRARTAAGNQMILIAGTGSNNTAHAAELSIAAQEAGADALLVVSPYYNKATPDGLIAHYLAIASSVRIPVILYNVPSRTGVDIPVEVCRSLSAVPNIIGVKEASPDLEKIQKIRFECGPDFVIWSGNDTLTVPILSLGGQGVISVASNLVPREMAAMTDSALGGDFPAAAAMAQKLLPLWKLLSCEVNPIPIKAAMKAAGFDCGPCRLPLTALKKENQKRIDQFFQ